MSEAPVLVGSFPDRDGVSPPTMRTWGSWRPGELRTVEHIGGRLVVVGQCFADDRRLRADFERALATDRPRSLTRWPGSYLTLVFREHDLTAFTDLAGQYPLYYRVADGQTVFGTHARATARASGLEPEPDLLTLAAKVICPDVPILTEDRSVYMGLSRLGGGQALRVTRGGHHATWTYETLAPDPATSFADAAGALKEALDAAVRARVDAAPRVSSDFSGGLDSTSLAFLAARHRPSAPLPVFTYQQSAGPASDADHARRYAGLDARLRLTVVRGTNSTLTYQDLDQAEATELPGAGVVVHARTRELLSRVANAGAGIHLGGEGADALLVAPPGYLADLARQRALRRLRRDCVELARIRKVSPARVLARSTRLSVTTVDRALRSLARRLDRPVDRCVEWLDAIAWWPRPGPEGGWLTQEMRRELTALVRCKAEGTHELGGLGVGDVAAIGEVRVAGAVQRQLDEVGRTMGVWPQAPFLDNEVIRACLSIPASRRANPLAFKPLLASALAGLVPAPVLSRQTKGNYSAEDYRGARLASGNLRNRVARLRLVELGVVERAPVMASLENAIDGLRAPFSAFNRLLATDLWLDGIEQATSSGGGDRE
ncbi:albusnodin/ikarugamycin family macrolactam cyclase [Actinophytocola sp.]|uniref:albusnodin/ikarugamycin family macrolactam cyclase n=1 Tax=Actinophytocola sp. TaxID=1872138 RepID=UPI002ED105D0